MRTHVNVQLLALAVLCLYLLGCDMGAETATNAENFDAHNASTEALKTGAFGDWSPAVDIESAVPGAHESFNTDDALEGCPFISRDGKMFFIASDRLGGEGGLDIWVSVRDNVHEPWGEPQNVGPPINTIHADFCPTLARDGHTFFFVSNRPGFCGEQANADIYEARLGPDGFKRVKHLGCEVNSERDEHGPFPLNMPGEGPVLFFSSARASGPGDAPGDHDIYMSRFHGGAYGPAELVEGLNTAVQDGQPHVRRDGLELFFYSNREESHGNDIYSASRASVFDAWSEPVNLGPDVNSDFAETRPSLSWDGRTLVFGSTRTGSPDIYITKR